MSFLMDPNISYLILVGGFVMAVLALFAPGTGLLEVGASLAIMLAAYSVVNLSFNWWAPIILVLGVFPFLLALRRSRNLVYLVISIAAMVAGTVFMLKTPDGRLAIDPILASIVSVLVAGFMWIIAIKSLDAMKMKPFTHPDMLVNQIGKTRTEVFHNGTVYVQSEEWSAKSSTPIAVGKPVKVLRQDGFTLIVEPLSEEEMTSDLLNSK